MAEFSSTSGDLQQGDVSDRLIKVSTTSDKRETLERIAVELIGKKQAACAQISGPVESVYRWQGEVQSEQEWLLTAKSVAAQFAAIEKTIQTEHHYEVPQVVAEPIILASQAYADWVRAEVESDG